MGHFENFDDEAQNLGNDSEFIPLEELAINPNSPDQFMMKKEEGLIVSEKVKEVFERDEDPSNWEEAVEKGEFDESPRAEAPEVEDGKISQAFRERHRADIISELSAEEQNDREYIVKYPSNASKPLKPRGDGDSIRFDEAV